MPSEVSWRKIEGEKESEARRGEVRRGRARAELRELRSPVGAHLDEVIQVGELDGVP